MNEIYQTSALYIRDVISLAPEDRYCFIMDNLNSHKSEVLVRLVVDLEGTEPEALGMKRRSGILVCLTYLSYKFSYTLCYFSHYHRFSVLCYPYNMIFNIVDRMCGFSIIYHSITSI